MNRMAFVVVVVLLLVVGGGLTSQMVRQSASETLVPAVLVQSENPEASTLLIAPWQGEQLFLFIGFILVNLIGIGVTIAAVMWFLHRGVKIAEATENANALAVSEQNKKAVQKS